MWDSRQRCNFHWTLMCARVRVGCQRDSLDSGEILASQKIMRAKVSCITYEQKGCLCINACGQSTIEEECSARYYKYNRG